MVGEEVAWAKEVEDAVGVIEGEGGCGDGKLIKKRGIDAVGKTDWGEDAGAFDFYAGDV